MTLPRVRACDGGCGSWLAADVPPAAEKVGHLGTATPVYLCTNCTRKLPGAQVIETKVPEAYAVMMAPVKRGPGRPRKAQ